MRLIIATLFFVPTISFAQANPQTVAPAPSRPGNEMPDGGVKFSGSLYYGLGNELKFSSTELKGTGNSISGSTTMETETAPGLALEIYQTPVQGWGFSAGLAYDFNRKINKLKFSSDQTTVEANFDKDQPTVGFLTLYGNAVYRWERLYLPFGINISRPSFDVSGTDASFTVEGGLGAQVGLGLHMTRHLAAEVMARYQAISISQESADRATKIEYGAGNMTGVQLQLKSTFN